MRGTLVVILKGELEQSDRLDGGLIPGKEN